MATTAELTARLEALLKAYQTGARSVGHGDKRVTYGSREDMRAVIAELRDELGITTRRNYSLAKHSRS
jgi:hypothetical protein